MRYHIELSHTVAAPRLHPVEEGMNDHLPSVELPPHIVERYFRVHAALEDLNCTMEEYAGKMERAR